MKTIASLFCCTLLSALACHSASAAPDVKVNLTARVVVIEDFSNVLGDEIHIGDVFSGSYSYDSTIPPQSTAPNANRYQMLGNVAHMRLALGATVIETQPANAFGYIDIYANAPNYGWDGFGLWFYQPRPLPNGATVINLAVNFRNDSGGAPITPALPTTAPDLQHWPVRTIDVSGHQFRIVLQIESATLEPPQVIEVSPSASRFLPQQQFDAMLLLPAGSTIVNAQASAHGTPVPLSYPGICTLAPPNSEGRPAILCPDAHIALDPTTTQIDWTVELAGGTILNKSVEWKLIQ